MFLEEINLNTMICFLDFFKTKYASFGLFKKKKLYYLLSECMDNNLYVFPTSVIEVLCLSTKHE